MKTSTQEKLEKILESLQGINIPANYNLMKRFIDCMELLASVSNDVTALEKENSELKKALGIEKSEPVDEEAPVED